jgi:L-ascorbate metabolism protein UlaG (beta-lactamase superfamily)
VLISHLHPDHLDRRSLRMIGESVPIVTPDGGAAILARRGFTSVTELSPGKNTELAGVPVRATEAMHVGGRFPGRHAGGVAGYLIDGPVRIYFAGDTDLFEGMAELRGQADVAILPIWVWGRTVGRGHLDPERAARAVAMIRPRIAVPMHWGTLAPMGARRGGPWFFERPAREFAAHAKRLAPEVEVRVLEPGDSTRLAEPRGACERGSAPQ